MVFGAYAPDLLFSSAAVAVAALAPASLAADAAAETAAVVNGTAAALAAVLRFIKFSWGSGFFVSAFACNCLKTAADRGHLWKTANRWVLVSTGEGLASIRLVVIIVSRLRIRKQLSRQMI